MASFSLTGELPARGARPVLWACADESVHLIGAHPAELTRVRGATVHCNQKWTWETIPRRLAGANGFCQIYVAK